MSGIFFVWYCLEIGFKPLCIRMHFNAMGLYGMLTPDGLYKALKTVFALLSIVTAVLGVVIRIVENRGE